MRSPAEKWNTEYVLGPIGSLECQSLALETLSLFPGNLKGKEWEQDDKWLHILLEAIFPVIVSLRTFVIWLKGWDYHVKVTFDGELPARCVHVMFLLLLYVSVQLLPIHTLRLGMEVDSFDGHHYISSIAPGGPLDTLNLLQPEDELLEVKILKGKKDTAQEFLSCRKMCSHRKSTELYHQWQYNVSY